MDRFVHQDGSDFQAGTVNVDLVFTAGTSGAVPSTFTYSGGVASVVKSTTTYVVHLQDNYVAFLGLNGVVLQASFSTAGACRVGYTAQQVTSATDPSITIQCYASDGTAVALATGDIINVTFRLKRL